jgi:competence protein ComEC
MTSKLKTKRRPLLLVLLVATIVCCCFPAALARNRETPESIASDGAAITEVLPSETAAPTYTAQAPIATATIVVEQADPEAETPTAATATVTDAAIVVPTTETGASPANGTLTVHFIDVGQGDAILIQSPDGKNMLIDGGEKNSGVVAYLQSQGVVKLDVVAATHPHSDHIGGLPEVLKAFPVDTVVTNGQEHTTKTYEDFLDAIIAAQAEYVEVMAGDEIGLGMLSLQVLGPVTLTDSLNDGSLVLRLLYGEVAFLFTGDAEAKAESMILGAGRPVKANILKVGHHASNTSTTAAFLQAVQPDVAVYSSGVGNRYGHPHAQTIARLSAVAEVYGTDQHGTVVVTTDGVTYEVMAQKQSAAPVTLTAAPTASPTVLAASPTSAPIAAPTSAPAPAELTLDFLSVSSPVKAGSTASVRVKTAPGANCTITVYYKSGASSAAGLDPKTAGSNGEVSWSWKVGSKTSPGDWRIVVTASQGGRTVTRETTFTVN